MDYTVQLESLITLFTSTNDLLGVLCGIFGLIAGLLIVLIFSTAWR